MDISHGNEQLDSDLQDNMMVFLAVELSHGITELVNKIKDTGFTHKQMEEVSTKATYGIHYLTKAVQHTLWHIRGCHQSEPRLQKLQKCVKGMPSLPTSQTIESCATCTTAKMRKKVRGARTEHPVQFPFQGIQMDPGFMFQKSKDKDRVQALEG